MQLAGDPATGLGSSVRLTAGKHETVVVYKDMLLTVDVYLVAGEPPVAHIYCPRCRKNLRISNKAIEFDPLASNPALATIAEMSHALEPSEARALLATAQFGKLSVERFECTWELGDEKHVPGVVHTGVSLCRTKLWISNNVAKGG
jgi:hypothetical protein